jgi:D-glycero-D-manno-heptose 1,7-bisphosphate phosphatase
MISETNQKRPAVFMDRDGTINVDVDYLSRVEDLDVYPFAVEAIKKLNDRGYLVIVVTNQSGIARGMITDEQLTAVHRKMSDVLAESGAHIDAYHHCPDLPDSGCRCRKPDTGMIEDANKEFHIDMEKSWMVGDKLLDVQMGQNAGIRSALVMTGYGERELEKFTRMPDLIGENLLDVVNEILAE